MGYGNGNSHANLTCNVSGKMFIYELNHLTHSYGNGPFIIYRCYIDGLHNTSVDFHNHVSLQEGSYTKQDISHETSHHTRFPYRDVFFTLHPTFYVKIILRISWEITNHRLIFGCVWEWWIYLDVPKLWPSMRKLKVNKPWMILAKFAINPLRRAFLSVGCPGQMFQWAMSKPICKSPIDNWLFVESQLISS